MTLSHPFRVDSKHQSCNLLRLCKLTTFPRKKYTLIDGNMSASNLPVLKEGATYEQEQRYSRIYRIVFPLVAFFKIPIFAFKNTLFYRGEDADFDFICVELAMKKAAVAGRCCVCLPLFIAAFVSFPSLSELARCLSLVLLR